MKVTATPISDLPLNIYQSAIQQVYTSCVRNLLPFT